MTTLHVAYGPDGSQFGELSLPTSGPARGTVVIVHGGFWRARYDLSLGRPLAADLAQRGYAVWNLEYRRVGNGGGWPMTFEDVSAGIDALADLDVDTAAVVAVGHSAGGHLATWAAGRSGARVPVAAVVSQAGVLDLVACARARLSDGAAFEQSERYVAAARAAGGNAQLIETRGDHFTLIDPSTPEWAVVVDALPELVLPR